MKSYSNKGMVGRLQNGRGKHVKFYPYKKGVGARHNKEVGVGRVRLGRPGRLPPDCSDMHAPEDKTVAPSGASNSILHYKSFKPLLYFIVLHYSVLIVPVFLNVGFYWLKGGCSCTVVKISTGLRALNKGYV